MNAPRPGWMKSLLFKEINAADELPRLRFHVTESLVSDHDGGVLFTVQLSGLPEKSLDDDQLEQQYNAIDYLLCTLGKSYANRLAVWSHWDHSSVQVTEQYKYKLDWMNRFAEGYMAQFRNKPVYRNRFYLTFLLKPERFGDLDGTIEDGEEVQKMVVQSLNRYSARLLKTYRPGEDFCGPVFSEVYEFFGWLYNGQHEAIPAGCELTSSIPSASHYFDYRLFETQFADHGHRFTALADLKELPQTIERGMLSHLLTLQTPFLVTTSFCFISAQKMQANIDQQINKLESAGDKASEQHEELKEAQAALQTGEVVFGDMHCSVAVYGDTTEAAIDNAKTVRNAFASHCSILVVPANASAPSTFFAQIPGAFHHRVRTMEKSTRVFAGLLGLHSPAEGKQFGNPVGDGRAIVPLQTVGGGVFWFNFHPTLLHVDARGKLPPGHAVILGKSGEGKTATQTVLLAFASRYEYRYFALDKDRSMRGFIEAQNGAYFSLQEGVPTGLNPFQLADTPSNRQMQYTLVAACARVAENGTAEDISDITAAVDAVYDLPFAERRFATVVQNLPDRGSNSVRRRLAEWVHGEQTGRYAYALDNDSNQFDWSNFHSVGFDLSDFLKAGHAVTEPLLIYLLHLKTMMVDQVISAGSRGRVATIVEEFWLALAYPTTESLIVDVCKTGRKRREDMILVSQSPSDACKCAAMPTIVENTSTKIFLPNPDAEYANDEGGGYSRVGLNEAEFACLIGLKSESRHMLIKQLDQCAIVKLDMSGQEDIIGVLAMASEDLPLLDMAKAKVGASADQWVPEFINLRRESKAANQRIAA